MTNLSICYTKNMKLYESGEYRASKDWPYAIAAGGIVYRTSGAGTEVLLLVREPGSYKGSHLDKVTSYHLPKGHLHQSETLEVTAIREIAEEAGVEAEIVTYLGAKQDEFEFRGLIHNKTVHYFAAKYIDEIQEMDNEHSSKEWFSVEDAVQLTSPPNTKGEDEFLRRLKKYLELFA